MDELEYYSPEEIEDMELQDSEFLEKSDFELIEDIASVSELYELDMDPHLYRDKENLLAEAERRGLFIRPMKNDWECPVCMEPNSDDSEWCESCGHLKGFRYRGT